MSNQEEGKRRAGKRTFVSSGIIKIGNPRDNKKERGHTKTNNKKQRKRKVEPYPPSTASQQRHVEGGQKGNSNCDVEASPVEGPDTDTFPFPKKE